MAQIPGTGFTSQQRYNPTVRGPADYSAQIQGERQKDQQRRNLRGAVQQAGRQLSDVTSRIVSAIQDHRVFQDSLMWEKALEKSADSVMKMVAGAGDEIGPEQMEGLATQGPRGSEGEAEGLQRWQMAQELFEKEAEKIFKQGRTSSGLFSGAGRRQFEQMKQQYWHRVRDRQQELFGMQLEHITEQSYSEAIENENPEAMVRVAQFARDHGAIKPFEETELRRNGLSEISYRQSSRDAMSIAQANGAVVRGMSNIDVALQASTPPSADLREFVTYSLQGRNPQEAADFVRAQLDNEEVDQQTAQAAIRMLTAPSNASGEVGPGLGVFRDPETNTWHLISNKQFETINSQVREYAETQFKARKFSAYNNARTQMALEQANGTFDGDGWRGWVRQNRGLLGYSNYDEKDFISKLLGEIESLESGAQTDAMYRETHFFGLVSDLMQNRHLPKEAAQEMIYDILQQIPEGTGLAKYDGLREWLVDYVDTGPWQDRSAAATDLFEFVDEQLDRRIARAEEEENWEVFTDLVNRKAGMQRDIMNYLTDQAEFDVNESGNLTYNERAAEQIRAALRQRASGSDFAAALQEMFGDPSGEMENVSFDLVNGRGFGRGDRKQRAVTAARTMSTGAAAGMDPFARVEFQNEAGRSLANYFAEEFGASNIGVRLIPRKNGEVYIAPRLKPNRMRGDELDNFIYQPENGGNAHHVFSYRDRNGDGTFEWMIANLGGEGVDGEIRWQPIPESVAEGMAEGYQGFTPLPDYKRTPAPVQAPQQPDMSGNANPYGLTREQMEEAGFSEEEIREAFPPEPRTQDYGGYDPSRGGAFR